MRELSSRRIYCDAPTFRGGSKLVAAAVDRANLMSLINLAVQSNGDREIRPDLAEVRLEIYVEGGIGRDSQLDFTEI
jgi:hypothetical protein